MTKLQNLYRAAIAADPMLMIDGLGILDGRWFVHVGTSKHKVSISHDYAEEIISAELGANTIGDMYAALERIARKEAAK